MLSELICDLKDEEDTFEFGRIMAQSFQPINKNICCYLYGDLGMGKTSLVRAFLRANNVMTPIKSPSFSIVEVYNLELFDVVHVDLYRIDHINELEYLGLNDYLNQSNIFFVEWADHGFANILKPDLNFYLSEQGSGRQLVIKSKTVDGSNILQTIKACIGESNVSYN